MGPRESSAALSETVPLHRHAEENLVFIREAMTRSASFTAVPGFGMILMGVIAGVGSWLATRETSTDGWIWAWTAIALLGFSAGVTAMCMKAYVTKSALWAGPGRRFILSFSPAIIVGIVLTEVFYWQHLDHLMPSIWLMLYGVAVMNGGAYSVRPVPITGLAFMALGMAAAFYPLDVPVAGDYLLRDAILAIGFGGFHIVLGVIVAWRHGG